MTQNRIKSKRTSKNDRIKVLQLLSDDMTQKQIASAMDLNVNTVHKILKKLRREMNCSSNERMIKIATQRLIIH